MTELHLDHAFAHGLGPLDTRFSIGLSVVLGASADDLASLCELLAGVRPARRGRVLLDGDDLGSRPSARPIDLPTDSGTRRPMNEMTRIAR